MSDSIRMIALCTFDAINADDNYLYVNKERNNRVLKFTPQPPFVTKYACKIADLQSLGKMP